MGTSEDTVAAFAELLRNSQQALLLPSVIPRGALSDRYVLRSCMKRAGHLAGVPRLIAQQRRRRAGGRTSLAPRCDRPSERALVSVVGFGGALGFHRLRDAMLSGASRTKRVEEDGVWENAGWSWLLTAHPPSPRPQPH